MSLGITDDIGRRIGMFMSIFAFGALAGPPISGAINTATGGFEAVGYYAGKSSSTPLGNMFLLILCRIYGASRCCPDVVDKTFGFGQCLGQILTEN
ncbi:hypothetical protein C0993_010233, partial [Termitomyces sp. T159_Od127]